MGGPENEITIIRRLVITCGITNGEEGDGGEKKE